MILVEELKLYLALKLRFVTNTICLCSTGTIICCMSVLDIIMQGVKTRLEFGLIVKSNSIEVLLYRILHVIVPYLLIVSPLSS